jgi:polysaccharide export outer membrane protein
MQQPRSAAQGGLLRYGQRWLAAVIAVALSGCYVPLRSPAIPACQLDDSFRMPNRSVARELNFANLTLPPPSDYILGPDDTLEITVSGLFEAAELRPLRARIMSDNAVTLPLVGEVKIGGMNLSQAQQAITKAYAAGFLVNPRVGVELVEKATVDVAVLGEVKNPGVYPLPRYQNDVAHALALAGGFSELAAEMVEVHRRAEDGSDAADPGESASLDGVFHDGVIREAGLLDRPSRLDSKIIVRIPLQQRPLSPVGESGDGSTVVPATLTANDVRINPGDVVVVPRQQDEVFFVVGKLRREGALAFSIRDRDRRLGNAFLLPPDRDVDAVTAVAMAGYIDPIDSPSTVTVQRQVPQGPPLLIHVDLIAARYDWSENVYIQPGDIVYLNPDPAWWFRRTFDRVIPDLITIPYAEGMVRWINPNRFR